jgi:MarR family transcriptional regulator, 2-MHQ and catechol-resistance regulon repressor
LAAQYLTKKSSPYMVAVGRLVGAHAALTRQLSAQLVAEHGLTLNEYEVLLLLSRAPQRSMRRVDLAHEVRLSPSGITRLLDRLQAAGLVGKRHCETDARVSYAQLTAAGMAKLERCAPDQAAAAERLLGDRFNEAELASLAELLGRLSAPADDQRVPTS